MEQSLFALEGGGRDKVCFKKTQTFETGTAAPEVHRGAQMGHLNPENNSMQLQISG